MKNSFIAEEVGVQRFRRVPSIDSFYKLKHSSTNKVVTRYITRFTLAPIE